MFTTLRPKTILTIHKKFRLPLIYHACNNPSPTHTVYYAAQEGHLDCVQCLVDQYKADPGLASYDGMTPLHAGAQTGRLNITHWLTRSAGCPMTCRTMDGATPMHFAAAKGEILSFKYNPKFALLPQRILLP